MSKDGLETNPYKGVRDFYPENEQFQKWLFGKWRETAERFGYVEYNASVFEPADLYKAKTSEEIINEQTYTFTDRGERDVTLRPEMTPTLARMVAARRRDLGFPLRWYSIPNLFRYETPQRGRLREHWQLNADIFGLSGIEAEIEVIALAYAVLLSLGAKESDFEIRINDRRGKMAGLRERKLSPEEEGQVFRLLDKKDKMPLEDWREETRKILGEAYEIEMQKSDAVVKILEVLSKSGIGNTRFEPTLVRGFDYYTGIVFEIFDTKEENRRSLAGGGRYDNLLSLFGEEDVPAVGFGMGDVTIRDFLESRGLIPAYVSETRCAILTIEEQNTEAARKLASDLRAAGINTSIDPTDRKIGDKIKAAEKNKVPFIIVVGDEEENSGIYKTKRLSDGEEFTGDSEKLSKNLKE